MKSIGVYCGSSPGNQPKFQAAARELGVLLAQNNIELVYGGGSVGLMGEIANATLAHGGQVFGVIPKFLMDLEVGHKKLTEIAIVDTMHERKLKMIERSEGFIAMPGGFGTMEELFEVLAWNQLGLHPHPCGLLNTAGYFDHLILFLEKMVENELLRETDHARLLVSKSPEEMLERLNSWTPPADTKW